MTSRSNLIAQLRGQLWYHHVLHTSGLSMSELDRAVDPPEPGLATVERRRHFKVLREKRTDPNKASAWRSWSLVDRTAERLPVCTSSRDLYHAELWGWLLGDIPKLEQIHEWIERKLAERGYFRPTATQVELYGNLIPESRLFEWSADHGLEWALHRWGPSVVDLSLVAGLVLEASLAKNWDVLDRWVQPLHHHIEAFKQQPWLRSKDAREEARQLGDQITEVLLDSPKTASGSPDPFIFRVISSPIVKLRGDVVWFLKWEQELDAALNKRSFEDPFVEGGELARLLAKRAEHVIKKRKGTYYLDTHRRERR